MILTQLMLPMVRSAEVDSFRHGRSNMGWSRAALAKTMLVPEQTISDWETGLAPIPPKALAWVAMYAHQADTTAVPSSMPANSEIPAISEAA